MGPEPPRVSNATKRRRASSHAVISVLICPDQSVFSSSSVPINPSSRPHLSRSIRLLVLIGGERFAGKETAHSESLFEHAIPHTTANSKEGVNPDVHVEL